MIGGKSCSICSSDRYIENHHYDCLGGKLSPETVPLCKRCHRSYHIWGVGCFSPDTTEKALEVENKRREILRSLPPNHERRRFLRAEDIQPMKLEDVHRSSYWYQKWGIEPPHRERRKGIRLPFAFPKSPALCGEDWVREHLNDYTPREIEALAIEISYDNNWLPPVSVADKKGKVKTLVRSCHE